MKVEKRSQRRHHRERMVARARRIQRDVWGLFRRVFPRAVPMKLRDHDAEKMADNMSSCQHLLCQMPQRVFGPRFSDRRRDQAVIHREECEECGADWDHGCESWCEDQRRVKRK